MNKKYWSRFFCVLLLGLAATLSWSQAENKTDMEIAGSWQGVLEVPNGKLRLVFIITQNSDGALIALMDSPDQGARGIPCSAVSWEKNKLVIELQSAGLSYSGEMTADGQAIAGTLTQFGQNFPMALQRSKEGATAETAADSHKDSLLAVQRAKQGEAAASTQKRPQEPKKPYPYREEEVKVTNQKAGIVLAGTLTLPPTGAPFPAVVLITGSGLQDRDETVFGHKPFLVLADHLTRNGIAVLRLDDRGMGQSGGGESIGKVTSEDFAEDIEAGLEFLRRRPDISTRNIGLIGHSEGGLIAPMIAARDKKVAFIVLLAGPGVSGEETILLQTARILQLSGFAPDEATHQYELEKKLLAAIRREKNDEKALATLRQIYNEAWTEQNAKGNKMMKPMGNDMDNEMKVMLSPGYRYFLEYDPARNLKKVSCPVLALNGSKDCQVIAKENLAGIEKALRAGGNRDFYVKELPDLNHLFQTAQTGNYTEYGQIEETMSPLALETISSWIRQRFANK